MIYKYAGGIGLVLLGISMAGVVGIPPVLTGIILVIAGAALILGQ